MSLLLIWLLKFVLPVTLKNNHITLTLTWVQYFLVFNVVLIVWSGWVLSYWLLLVLPLIFWQFHINQLTLNHQKQFNLVMNAECQWKLVHVNDLIVAEARVKEYWVTPLMISINLVSDHGKYHCMVFRNAIDGASYSRLNIGIQNNE